MHHLFSRLCLCLFVTISVAGAQPLPERRPLSGRVTQPDGAPIKGAAVTLAREIDQGGFSYWGGATLTDTNGYFLFSEADEDSYRISVDAPGYTQEAGKQFILDSNTAPLSIVLQRLADVRFRFLNADGTRLINSPIVYRTAGDALQGRSSQPIARKTDSKGEYLLEKQPPGRYRFQVVSPDAGYANLDDLNIAYSPTPNLIEVRLQRGGTLRLKALGSKADGTTQPLGGATLSLGPVLKITAQDRAAGRILRPEDNNLQSLYAWSPDGSGAATRDGDGILELTDLPPGQYRARLLLSGAGPIAWQDVEVKSGATATLDFTFPLNRDFRSVEVLVRDKKGQPVANTNWNLQLRLLNRANSEIAPPLPNEDPAPEPVPDMMANISLRRARSDEAGRFVLFPLQPGRWRVLLTSPRDLKDNRVRGDNYQKDVQVSADGASVTFEVNATK